MSGDKPPANTTRKGWWQKLVSLPGILLTTGLTVVVSWAVTQALTSMQSHNREQEQLDNPVSVSTESNPARVGGFSDLPMEMILPFNASSYTKPGTGCLKFHDYMAEHGGVDSGVTRLQVVVQGLASGQVLISDMRAVVVDRGKPLTGIPVRCPTAGAANIRAVTLDLDDPTPHAHYTGRPREEFGFTVQQGETETFLVTATTTQCTCRWHLEMELVVMGERRTITVTDNGSDFYTTTTLASPPWEWDFNQTWFGPGRRIVQAGESFPIKEGG
jgi:hypothetical protein